MLIGRRLRACRAEWRRPTVKHVNGLVIAIDGPSGSGKSSTARGVAQRLGLAYLDTGAMYRSITWLALHEGTDLADADAIAALAADAEIEINGDPAAPAFRVNGHDVTAAIREPRISENVSRIATNLRVRDILVADQRRRIAEARMDGGIVVEGRDITTVVAPESEVRVLLVADREARIARREAELAGAADTAAVTDQVVRRDRDDSTVAAFTEAAEGVTVVDSTHMGLDEVIDRICAMADPASTPISETPDPQTSDPQTSSPESLSKE